MPKKSYIGLTITAKITFNLLLKFELKYAVNLILLFVIWLLMMLFSHDFVAENINIDNEKYVEQIESGTHHFSTGEMTLDDVVNSFQTHWEQSENGLSNGSERPEISIDLNGFVIAPRLHQTIKVSGSFDDLSNEGMFKLEFSNQRDQLYYDSNEVSLSQVFDELNLNDLNWTLNDLNIQESARVPILWSEISQLDAWVMRFYPSSQGKIKLNSVSINQFEPEHIESYQRLSCDHDQFSISDCLVSNKMRHYNESSIYHQGFSLVTFDTYLPLSFWLFLVLAWVLTLVLVLQTVKRSVIVYLLVTAVFLTVLISHQNLNPVTFDILGWAALLLAVIVLWIYRKVFLQPKNQALPVWLISGVVAILLLGLSHSDTEFLRSLPMYFLWACVQQMLIGPLFSSSLKHHLKSPDILIACLVGVLFSVIHAPNHMLMLVTLIGGTSWSYAWLKYENIYANAFSHALLALIFYQVMPDVWLGSARIGVFF